MAVGDTDHNAAVVEVHFYIKGKTPLGFNKELMKTPNDI